MAGPSWEPAPLEAAPQLAAAAAPAAADAAALQFVMFGPTSAGKSALLSRLATGAFVEPREVTVGVDFRKTRVDIAGRSVNVVVWDTAGTRAFRAISHSYARGAHGALVVFNVTSRESFADVPDIVNDLKRQVSPGVPFMLVGNFADSARPRAVAAEEAAALAAEVGTGYMEACPTTGRNVDAVFRALAERALVRADRPERATAVVTLAGPSAPQRGRGGGACAVG
jgi:small GTP-binding protein